VRVLAAGLLGIALTAFVAIRSVDPDVYHHDKAWILYTAGEMLDGAQLYVDLLDENPPLVFWMAVPSVAVARALDVAPVRVFDLAVWLAIAGSLGVGFLLLQRGGSPEIRDAPLALACLLATGLVLLPGADFGQREHLLVVLATPYVFGAVRSLEGRPVGLRVGIAIGVLAGVAVALKPYFAAVPAAVEVALLVSRRDLHSLRRAEPWVLAAVQIGYAASVVLFAPAYIDLLELTWPVYNAYAVSVSPFRFETLAVAAGIAIACFVKPTGLLRRVVIVAGAAAVGGLAVAYLQQKGWDYHFLPAALAATLLYASLSLAVAERWPRASARSAAVVVLLVAATATSVWRLAVAVDESFGEASREPSVNRVLSGIAREHAAGRPVLFLSTSVNPAFPVVNLSGARWGQRFCCLWVLPAVYTPVEKRTVPFPYHDIDAMSALERYALDALMADMAANRPELIVVDAGKWKFAFGRTDFDHLAYFLRDPRFAAMFSEYEFLANVAVFQVFRRAPRVE